MKDSVVVEKGAGKAKKSHQRAQILPQRTLILIHLTLRRTRAYKESL